MKKTLFGILKVAVSLGLLAVLIYRAGLGEIAAVLRSASPMGLLVALAVYTATIFLISWRWQLLLASQGTPISFRQLLSLNFIGLFFNNFLPTSIGGDIYRAVGAGQESGRKAISAASVLVERLMGMLAISALAIAAILMVRPLADSYVQFLTFGFGLAMLLLLALFFHGRTFGHLDALTRKVSLWGVERKLLRLYQALSLYRARRGILAVVFVISLAYQLLIVLFSYLVSVALGLGVSWRYFLLCVPVTVIISLAPISINGMGIRETGYVLLLSKIGHDSPQAIGLSLLIYALSLVASLAGGILFLLRGARSLSREPSGSSEMDQQMAQS